MLARLVLLLALPLSTSHIALAQEISPVDRAKLRQAERTADRFVERFRQTLDFGTVWREFQVSDASCAYKITGLYSEVDYRRLKFSNDLLERLFIAYMNLHYLSYAYGLNAISLGSDDAKLSEEKIIPKKIQAAMMKTKYVRMSEEEEDTPSPQNAKEVRRMITELNHVARLWRKHMPRNLMLTAAWQANIKYLLNKGGVTHLGVDKGSPYLCIPDDVKYYTVDRGLFYFRFVEENGSMKVAAFAIGY
jgi:hypothetical protein